MQFRKSSYADIRCTCNFFPNGSIKTPVEAVEQTCCERRNYLKSAKHFLFAGRDIRATLAFSVFAQFGVSFLLKFHCSVLDISLAEEKNVGIYCFRCAL